MRYKLNNLSVDEFIDLFYNNEGMLYVNDSVCNIFFDKPCRVGKASDKSVDFIIDNDHDVSIRIDKFKFVDFNDNDINFVNPSDSIMAIHIDKNTRYKIEELMLERGYIY